MVALASHHAAADARTSKLEELFRKAGINSPSLEEAAAALGMPNAETQKQAAQLAQTGSLVKIAPELYLHRETVENVKQLLPKLSVVSVQEVRNALNTSRKYVVPLLEYFDTIGVTRRIGNERVLRDRPSKDA
jgi:selenocysteine-specific elongation factor